MTAHTLRNRLMAAALITAAAFLFPVRALAQTAVVILNPSFELPSVGSSVSGAQSWQAGTVGSTISTVRNPQFYPATRSLLNGNQMAYLRGSGSLLQTLTRTYQPGATYQLQVVIGEMTTTARSTIELRAGTTVLKSTTASSPASFLSQMSMTYTVPAAGVPVGQPITIHLVNVGRNIYFDNIQLIETLPVTVSVQGGTATEGTHTTLPFTLTLSRASTQPVTVNYSTSNGTATAGQDYTATTGTATIPAGQTSITVNVPIINDSAVEPDETVRLTLSNPANATLGTAQATGTIQSDDRPTLSIEGGTSLEGVDSNLLFAILLSHPFNQPITVTYATRDGSATADQDYTATAGTITLQPGQTSQLIAVPIINDSAVEPDETVRMSLSNATGATLTTADTTGTIQSDDIQLVPPTVSIEEAIAIEGAASNTGDNTTTNTANFTVRLSRPLSEAVTVDYSTTNGTARAGSDYIASAGTLTIPPGELTGVIQIQLVGDSAVERDETFSLILSNPTNATLGSAQATGTIQNDDQSTQTLEVFRDSANRVFVLGVPPGTRTLIAYQNRPRRVRVRPNSCGLMQFWNTVRFRIGDRVTVYTNSNSTVGVDIYPSTFPQADTNAQPCLNGQVNSALPWQDIGSGLRVVRLIRTDWVYSADNARETMMAYVDGFARYANSQPGGFLQATDYRPHQRFTMANLCGLARFSNTRNYDNRTQLGTNWYVTVGRAIMLENMNLEALPVRNTPVCRGGVLYDSVTRQVWR